MMMTKNDWSGLDSKSFFLGNGITVSEKTQKSIKSSKLRSNKMFNRRLQLMIPISNPNQNYFAISSDEIAKSRKARLSVMPAHAGIRKRHSITGFRRSPE